MSTANPEIKYRTAGLRDAATFADIEKECFPEGGRWDADDFEALLSGPTSAWLAEFQVSPESPVHVWLSPEQQADCHPVGFVLMELEPFEGKQVPYISTIDTRDKWRGLGIASHLMNLAEKDAKDRGFDRMMLHVNTTNEALILYFKRGYRVVAFEKGFYAELGDAVVMEKKL